MSNPVEAKRWTIKGTVQGVGFRYFVQREASALGLAGWASNSPDGSVEIYAEGPPAKMAELATALRSGPSMAEVQSMDERQVEPENVSGFAVR